MTVMSQKKCISISEQFLELNRKLDAMRESGKEEVASLKNDISTLKDEISTLQDKTEFIMIHTKCLPLRQLIEATRNK